LLKTKELPEKTRSKWSELLQGSKETRVAFGKRNELPAAFTCLEDSSRLEQAIGGK
jgi:hypothetical protein